MSISFSALLATRTASTSGRATRARFGAGRSSHTHANPLSFLALRTEKANRSSLSVVAGNDRAMRRTSRWSATALSLPGGHGDQTP